jgi:diguanylate cyclase (GGDEF)-like protein
MKKRILFILLFFCCNAWSESNSTVIDDKLDLSTIIEKVEQTRYSNTEYAKALVLKFLQTPLSNNNNNNNNIKQQIQLYEILGELEIEVANYEAAISYYSTALSLSEEINEPSLMSDILNSLTLTFQKSGAYVQALETADSVISLSQRYELTLQKGEALHNKGRIFHIQGEYDRASSYFLKTKKIYQSMGNKKKIAQVLSDQGNTAVVKGAYQEAIQYFFEALNIHKVIDDKDGKSEINLDLGIVYSALGELTTAEKHFRLAIDKNPVGREAVLRNARVYFNLADLFSQSNDFHKAVSFSKKSIEAASRYDEQRILTYAYLNLAEASIPNGNYAQAQLAINKSLEYTQNNKAPRLEIYSHLLDSRISVKNGDLFKAETALVKSMELAKEINAEESLLIVIKELSELYASKDELPNAYQYLLDYVQLKDKILNEKNKRALFQEQEKFNTIEQQKTIIKLENEKLIASLEVSNHKVRNFIFISFILLLLVTLSFLFLRYRHNIKSAAVINKANNELKQAYIEIENIALTDSLTLLKNRRSIVKSIQDQYLQFKRHKRDFCIMLIDIDFFKKFNDTYGHHCGDMVLKEVAQCIKAVARETDEVARWGGEEFLVFLPDTTIENAKLAAERTRQAVEELKINYVRPGDVVAQKLNLTITLGVTNAWSDDVSSDSIVVRADRALYDGKEQGRNCVISV